MLKVNIIIFTVDKCKPISVYCFIYTVKDGHLPLSLLLFGIMLLLFFEIEKEKVLKLS